MSFERSSTGLFLRGTTTERPEDPPQKRKNGHEDFQIDGWATAADGEVSWCVFSLCPPFYVLFPLPLFY